MPKNAPQAPAMRRIALQFDKDGNPASDSVTSPKPFKVRATVVPPPHDVIPVIFVPGIAGSRLRTKVGHEPVWDPPNGTLSALGAAYERKVPDMGTLQRLWDPQNTEVDPEGDCAIGDQTYWLTEGEAKRRGWGELHALSYHAFLQRLEKSLNDRRLKAGFKVKDGKFLLDDNFPLEEIGILQYLKAGSPASSITEADRRANQKRAVAAHGKSGMYGHAKTDKLDYAKLAKETIAAWGRTPQPLSDEEIKRLSNYYYPVWAYGYNWLGDPELAAKGLIERIETILEHYEKTTYFQHQGKVIVVTHSMGGLIARRAAQIDDSKILGVVHGVCPLVGAAVLYRRLRSGQEGGGIAEDVVAAVMGNTQAEMALQLGRSPGAFTLAPTRDYPMHWLKIYATEQENGDDLILSLPVADPYEEIYSKTTEDVWWGMMDPALLDPMGVMTEENRQDPPATAYRKAMTKAKEFHDKLKLYAHPETYGFYGTDNDKYRSFGHVSWLCGPNGKSGSHELGSLGSDKSIYAKHLRQYLSDPANRSRLKDRPRYSREQLSQNDPNRNVTDSGWGYAAEAWSGESFGYARLKPGFIPFWLSEERNTPGDGTVPECSGEMLKKLTPPLKEVFGIPGYGHQGAFDDEIAYRATIYSITRIVQKAEPPKKS